MFHVVGMGEHHRNGTARYGVFIGGQEEGNRRSSGKCWARLLRYLSLPNVAKAVAAAARDFDADVLVIGRLESPRIAGHRQNALRHLTRFPCHVIGI